MRVALEKTSIRSIRAYPEYTKSCPEYTESCLEYTDSCPEYMESCLEYTKSYPEYMKSYPGEPALTDYFQLLRQYPEIGDQEGCFPGYHGNHP
jgi:hypothetical protein